MLSTLLKQGSTSSGIAPYVVSGARLSAFFSSSSRVNQGDSYEVEVLPYKVHRIDSPPTTVTTTKDELMSYYREMQLLRRMEVAADIQYKAKFIRGFCHLYDGQEAVIIGIKSASNELDSIITSYRDHCTHVAKGGTVREVMGELMGKLVGASRGVGGSMHMYNKKTNYYGGAGIVGAQIPVGAGLALAHKMKNDGLISYALYGDGAANQGQKYEALNIAGLWNLPCIFVCENNHYGMGTAEWRAAKSPDFYTRGDYIPGIKVDGMDVLAVKNAVGYAREHALSTGPIILEMDTYRYHGHSMSDPGSTYRTRDEVSTMRQERDPILRVKKLLMNVIGMDEKELKAIDKEVKTFVDNEVEECKKAPEPTLDYLYSNIYQNTQNMKMRGVDSASYHDAKLIPY